MRTGRMTAFVLAAALAAAALPGMTAQAAQRAVTITIDYVAQKPVDQAPYQDTATNRVMIPISFVSQALGHTVDWDNATRTVTIDGVWTHVEASKLMTNTATKKTVELPVPSVRDKATNRLLLPVNFVTDALGYQRTWDEAAATVNILTGKPVYDPNAPFDYKNVNPAWVVPGYDPAVHGKPDEELAKSPNVIAQKTAIANLEVEDLTAQYFYSNLRFIKEAGKYYVTGKMPLVPYLEGYRLDFYFYLTFGNGTQGVNTSVIVGPQDMVQQIRTANERYNNMTGCYGVYSADGGYKVEVPANCAKYDAKGSRSTILSLYAICGIGDGECVWYSTWTDRGLSQDTSPDQYNTHTGVYKIPGGKASIVLWK